MKTILFFFALLAGVTASANVYITPLSTDYTNKTVTFRVEWTGDVANNRVWVFVDLCPVDGTTSGTFTKAVISGATHTAGGIDASTLPGRGFYVTANLTTVSVTLSNATGQFNWCAYGSGFPPNAKDDGSGGYILRGSLPFTITTTSGALEVPTYGYTGGVVTALTDATGEPGILCGGENESAGLLGCCKAGLVNCDGTCKLTCSAIQTSQCRFPCAQWWDTFDMIPVNFYLFNQSHTDFTEVKCADYATQMGFKYYNYARGHVSGLVYVECCMCKNMKLE
ncbi:MAG: hypothetical protein LBU42_10505 [Prevotellaceae bacterium]|jgi:hypothetical protein|nr:hypothetical protein [Prevotellaceae bacterium]